MIDLFASLSHLSQHVAAPIVAAVAGSGVLGWLAPTPKALIEDAQYVFDTLKREAPRNAIVIPPLVSPSVLSKGATDMALLDLLPAGVRSFIQSPEAADDIKLGEALLAGDTVGATAALKASLSDAPVAEPYKEILGLFAASEQFDAYVAGKLVEEVAALKAAVVG